MLAPGGCAPPRVSPFVRSMDMGGGPFGHLGRLHLQRYDRPEVAARGAMNVVRWCFYLIPCFPRDVFFVLLVGPSAAVAIEVFVFQMRLWAC